MNELQKLLHQLPRPLQELILDPTADPSLVLMALEHLTEQADLLTPEVRALLQQELLAGMRQLLQMR